MQVFDSNKQFNNIINGEERLICRSLGGRSRSKNLRLRGRILRGTKNLQELI